jgi:hypothetical protein
LFLGEAAIYQNGDEKGVVHKFDIYGAKSNYHGNVYDHTIKVLSNELRILEMTNAEFNRLMKPYLKKLEAAANKLNAFSNSLS